ncbi:efflux transporter outer membrane subunit [uncultured Thiothrix sp.]|uniref:efflux transporter outer membrane subunit n=1 Tax=uncultured Thiothrix sp. TaxID=223185 RepID=UPI002605BD5B|nr:efflux transporter outer membrane subunit [uncultured Thiothrix sp.]HMT94088.1 efflux transporter outer membrane subunit [Thiolinea sp.]
MSLRLRPAVLIVSVCLALVACAPMTETSKTPQAVQTANNSLATAKTQRASIQAAWWQKFNDPLMTALIQDAWQANPDLASAKASVKSARAQGVIAGASLLPSLSSSASARTANGSGTSLSAGMDASWELDIFGANRLASAAAQSDVKAAEASYEDVKASLAAEVASAYVNLRLAQARLGVAQQNSQSRKETVNLTNLRQQAGLTSGLEVEQSKLSLGQTQAQIPALEGTVARSKYALAILSGKTPAALDQRLKVAKPIPNATRRLSAEIPANALRQRPDLRAAEYRVAAASARMGEAKANLNPSFNLGGSLSLTGKNLGDLLDINSLARSLLASISAPLFDGGRLKQQVVVRDAAYEQAVATYQKTILSALQDVANNFATLAALQKQQPILAQNLQLARSAENLARLSYNAGTADFQNVLDAQRSVLSAQESLLSAQADYSLALIRLYKAVGGSW